MPTSAEPLLLDTSAAIALVQQEHPAHPAVLAAVRGHPLGLSGHAETETYSVLTRLPPPHRLTPPTALRLIRANFPQTKRLPSTASSEVLEELVTRGLAGGTAYDALVGLAARHHDLPLLSCDARAASTYQALGVRFALA